jgi:hypothetical protein
MNRRLCILILNAILLGMAGGACAQSVHTCNYTGQPGSQPSNCLGADDPALKSSQIQGMVFSQPFAISNALSQRMAGTTDGGPFSLIYPGMTGAAAGAVANTSNVWLSYGNVRAANTLPGSNFGATINNYTVGYDYAWSRSLVFGLSIASSDSSANTYFNSGRYDGKGYVAAPYLSYELNKNWSADASAGWGQGNQTTTAFGSNASGGVDRSFAAANLNGTYWFGRGQFASRFSLLNGMEKLNTYTLGGVFVPQVKNSLTQAAAMARYGYWFEGFMPYASVTLTSDLDRTTNPVFQTPGRDAWIPKVGVDFFSKRGLTGGVSYSSEQGRGATKNDVWSANMSFRF